MAIERNLRFSGWPARLRKKLVQAVAGAVYDASPPELRLLQNARARQWIWKPSNDLFDL
jgi:hypothetical protein